MASTSSRNWTVGARVDCDIVIHSPWVSGRHCVVTRSSGQLAVRDLGSTNGTFVNGTKVSEATFQPTDVITLGSDVLLSTAQFAPRTGLLRRLAAVVGLLGLALLVGLGAILTITAAPKPERPTTSHGTGGAAAGEESTEQPKQNLSATPGAEVGRVVVTDDQGRKGIVGLCWAIDEHTLITTASVVEVVAASLASSTPAYVECAGRGQLAIRDTAVHPAYASSVEDRAKLVQQHQEQRSKYDELVRTASAAEPQSQPGLGDDIRELVTLLHETERTLQSAVQNELHNDVGLLTIDSATPALRILGIHKLSDSGSLSVQSPDGLTQVTRQERLETTATDGLMLTPKVGKFPGGLDGAPVVVDGVVVAVVVRVSEKSDQAFAIRVFDLLHPAMARKSPTNTTRRSK